MLGERGDGAMSRHRTTLRVSRTLLHLLAAAALWPGGATAQDTAPAAVPAQSVSSTTPAGPVAAQPALVPTADLESHQSAETPDTVQPSQNDQQPGDEERGTDIPDENDSPKDAEQRPSAPPTSRRSTSATPSSRATPPTRSAALPRTGVSALSLAALGLLMLAGGLRLRRAAG